METSTQIFKMIKYQKKVLDVFFISNFDRFCFFRTGKNYYPQVFLEQCKYAVKEEKMPQYITDEIEISSDDSGGEDSDEENSDKENFNEENFDEVNQVENNRI